MVRHRVVVPSVLVVHAILVGWIGLRMSPTIDEPGHLAAGVYTWKFGRFDVYRVNPPLARWIAAVPAVLAGVEMDWWRHAAGPAARPEWDLGVGLFTVNGQKGFWYMTLARWAVIPLSVVGAYVCYCWACALYGKEAGLAALVLWCFCPNVVAVASTITSDAAASALGAAAGFVFWRWLRGPNWIEAVGAGLVLGFAELTKTTWIVLYLLWPLVWFVWLVARRRDGAVPSAPRQMAQLATILLVAVYVVNVGYAFEGTCMRLGEYSFVSRALAGGDSVADGGLGGNRFAGQWLGRLPVPFPEDYLSGIDLQKLDFEKGKDSYLCGEWKRGGWWWYYVYAAVVKIPLGTWLLGILAAVLTAVGVRGRHRASRLEASQAGYSAGWLDELTLLVPAVTVFILISSQTGFDRYFRYVAPCLPFVFIWISKVARALPRGNRAVAMIGGAALTWSVGSGLWVYPHSMSYFNELTGGPTSGHYHLLDSNIDWGQDLLYLKAWLDEHPEARPLGMDCFTSLHPEHFGIECFTPPPGPRSRERASDEGGHFSRIGPHPGWYAMSVHRIHEEKYDYEYFLRFRPVAMAGYSIYIYHVTLEEANRVRRELGLPELPGPKGADIGPGS